MAGAWDVMRGRFATDADVRFVAGTPLVELLAPLVWVDADGRAWRVPRGALSDGASIPRWAWVVIGHPFDWPYRRAAILHDHQCRTRPETSAAVHWRFRQAMLADGAPAWRAWLVWAAVRVAGPRWGAPAQLAPGAS